MEDLSNMPNTGEEATPSDQPVIPAEPIVETPPVEPVGDEPVDPAPTIDNTSSEGEEKEIPEGFTRCECGKLLSSHRDYNICPICGRNR
jgi:hypothetical protein